ncbi:MAG: leucine-rich repeat protein [Clostridiales bacterium]|nr:leucine-rich repeat protein [Clostridiales bacterium]
MTEGVIGYWDGNLFGTLCLGKGLCLSYTSAYTYLVQWLYPEVYGTSTSMTSDDLEDPDNWKATDDLVAYDADGNIDVDNSSYIVDWVRITFDANVTMYGETNEDFNSDHYWNAVKITNDNGEKEWYYIDSCYIDIYVECMVRERVETNGNMNHTYFLMSDDTARDLYDGYYDTLDTLYEGIATDTSYESDSWMYYAASNVYTDDENYYYLYDSTDLITTMAEYGDMDMSSYSSDSYSSDAFSYEDDAEYKLVSYAKTDKDVITDEDADKYTTVYIDFNNGQVLNASGEMEDNELIAELFAQYEEYTEIYPSVEISAAYYNNKLYFNLSNCVLSYDLDTCEVVRVKEYNEVYAVRDKSVEFGGMAFSVTSDSSEADLSITNPPVAGLTIKDGNLYVDLATNYCFISGKSSVDDTSSYGYEFQESNYNSDYSNYMAMMMNNMDESDSYYSLMQSYYGDETNDNDEFMWSANFTDTVAMSTLTGSNHNYQTVSVEAYCGRDAFTESRCLDCGLINDGTRSVSSGTACDHHYVHFEETYYTTDDDTGEYNTGDCYVCTICGYSVEEEDDDDTSTSDDEDETEETGDTYEEAAEKAGHTYTVSGTTTWEDDYSSVTIGSLTCSLCSDMTNGYGYNRDCLVADDTITCTDVECTDVEYEVEGDSTDCSAERTVTYTVSTAPGGTLNTPVTTKATYAAGLHDFAISSDDCTWTQTSGGGYELTAVAKMTCKVCGETVTENISIGDTSATTTSATCEDTGKTVYKATVTATETDEDGTTTTIGFAVAKNTVTIDATGHTWGSTTWGDWTQASDGSYTITATRTCRSCGEVETGDVEVTSSTSDGACESGGTITYTATATFSDGTTSTTSTTVDTDALGHDYEDSWTWNEDYSVATVVLTCSRCGDTLTYNSAEESEDGLIVTAREVTNKRVDETCTTDGSRTYKAYITVDGTKYKDETTIIVPATGHTWEDVVWTDWTEADDGSYTTTASRTCNTCGEVEEADVAITTTPVSATCTEAGSVIYNATATFSDGTTDTNDSDPVEVAALGHDYVTSWAWTDNYTKATVTLTCSRGDDTQTVEATVEEDTSARVVETCTTAGSYTYIATAIYDGVTYTNTKTKTVAALGHSYNSNGVCTRCGVTSSKSKVGASISDSTGTYSVTSTGTTKTVTYTKASSTATSVTIPSTVTVDGMTFKVTAISASAFKGNTKIKTVTVPSTVATIGKSAFEGCTALTTVKGCASVTSIGNRAFYNCKKLTQVGSTSGKVKLTKVKTIGSYAFYGCKSITVVNITSKNLTKIKNFAFMNCTKLKKFVAKSTKLAKIGKKAFYGDKKLANVTLKTTKLKNSNVGAKAFTGTKSNCTFKVPAKKMSAYKTLFKKKGAGAKIKVKK